MKGFSWRVWKNDKRKPNSKQPQAIGKFQIPCVVVRDLSIAIQQGDIPIVHDDWNKVDVIELDLSVWQNDPSTSRATHVLSGEVKSWEEQKQRNAERDAKRAQQQNQWDQDAGVAPGPQGNNQGWGNSGWGQPHGGQPPQTQQQGSQQGSAPYGGQPPQTQQQGWNQQQPPVMQPQGHTQPPNGWNTAPLVPDSDPPMTWQQGSQPHGSQPPQQQPNPNGGNNDWYSNRPAPNGGQPRQTPPVNRQPQQAAPTSEDIPF